MKTLPLLFIAPLLFASCGSDADKKNTAPAAAEAPRRKTLSERFSGTGADPNGFKRDADGRFVANKDAKRSPYENVGADPNFSSKDYKKTEYKTGDYTTKSFWGNKQYDKKAYSGNTDGSRFQKESKLQAKGAREAGTQADLPGDYQTSGYATGSAREAGASPIDKPSNAAIDNRQKVFKEPEIIDWQERRKLTMDQSKGLLRH